jgi:hypothetical protein
MTPDEIQNARAVLSGSGLYVETFLGEIALQLAEQCQAQKAMNQLYRETLEFQDRAARRAEQFQDFGRRIADAEEKLAQARGELDAANHHVRILQRAIDKLKPASEPDPPAGVILARPAGDKTHDLYNPACPCSTCAALRSIGEGYERTGGPEYDEPGPLQPAAENHAITFEFGPAWLKCTAGRAVSYLTYQAIDERRADRPAGPEQPITEANYPEWFKTGARADHKPDCDCASCRFHREPHPTQL